jgi:hypothetical protein
MVDFIRYQERQLIYKEKGMNKRFFYFNYNPYLGFHRIPENQGIYSNIEVGDIIMVIKWIKYIRGIDYCSNLH